LIAIGNLLEKTVAELKRFLAVITTERRLLVAGDIDHLPGISEEKSALATRLADLETQRNATLVAAGFGAGRTGVDAWLASIPATSSRSPQNVWQVCLALAAEARRENEVNGKLIGVHLQQNQQVLDSLLGEVSGTNTYGADGQRRTVSGGRPLGRA
jgi:flagellar biosynthesis/type III secretory pathway chaperone